MMTDVQLSLDVREHPHIRANGGGIVVGTLKVQGDFSVRENLHPGDELQVVVTDADGQVVAQGAAEVAGVALLPIREKDVGVIGTERAHKAKLAS